MKPNSKKKPVLTAIVGLAVGAITFFLVQQYFFRTPSFDEVLIHNVKKMNKSCPIIIDEETRLDKAVILSQNVVQYNYTLLRVEKKQVDIDQLKTYITPNLVNNVKSHPDLKLYRDHDTTLQYSYSDKNGELLFTVTVTPERYK